MFYTALSRDGKKVAFGGADGKDKKITGTAHVWDVQSLPTSPPKFRKDAKESEAPAQSKTVGG